MKNKQNLKSDEEKDFAEWLEEAEYNGLVTDLEYEPHSFLLSPKQSIFVEKQLKTKIKQVEKFLLHQHSYTPDFRFIIKDKLLYAFFKKISGLYTYVDTKGTWSNRGSAQEFSINQKWVYEKYGVFINKIIPSKLFKKTWVPELCRLTPKKRQPKKEFINCISIGEFINKS